jgi:hypothetical protein
MAIGTCCTLLAAAPAFSQNDKTYPITLAEAQAMTPQEIAARFLPDDVTKNVASASIESLADGVVWRIVLNMSGEPIREAPGVCRMREYHLIFNRGDLLEFDMSGPMDLDSMLPKSGYTDHYAVRTAQSCAEQDASNVFLCLKGLMLALR